MTDEAHKWESDHAKDNDIEYGLFFLNDLVFKSKSKPEIMMRADDEDLVKDSYKDPFEFVTAPHLKAGVVIKMRSLKPVWRVVGEDEDKGIKCMKIVTSEGF